VCLVDHNDFYLALKHTAMLPTEMKLPEPLHSASIGNSHVVLQME